MPSATASATAAPVRSPPAPDPRPTLVRLGPAAGALVAGALALLAIVVAADTVWTVLRLHEPVPYFDEWDSLAVFRSIVQEHAPLAQWFSQHNEHRIFFPRLVLFSDDLFLGGRSFGDLAVILAIQIAQVAMLLAMFRRAGAGAFALLSFAGVATVLLFSLRQEENFFWGFQVSFVGVFAAATASCLAFGRAVERSRAGRPFAGWLALAYAMAFVDTFTMANGILDGFVLVVLAGAARMRWSVVLATAVVAVLLVGAYLYGYVSGSDHPPQGISHALGWLRYTAIYLGNVIDSPALGPPEALGACGMLAAAVATWQVLAGRERDPMRLALCGVILFTGGTALLTGFGRLPFGIESAMASRYWTGSAAFWIALFLFWWPSGAQRPGGWRLGRVLLLRGVIAGMAAFLCGYAWRSQVTSKPPIEARAVILALGTDAMLQDLVDPEVFAGIYPDLSGIREVLPLLRERQIAIFADRRAHALGHPIADLGALAPPRACPGDFGTATPDPNLGRDGVRVAGRMPPAKRYRPLRLIYIADREGRVTGIASGAAPSATDPESWTGYATAGGGAELRAYLMLDDGRPCPLGNAIVRPAGS